MKEKLIKRLKNLNLSLVIFIIVFCILHACFVNAEEFKLAIIDSGFNLRYEDGVRLCATGHYNVVNKKLLKKEELTDEVGHGTHMALTAASFIQHKKYCIIVIKINDASLRDGRSWSDNLIARGINYAATQNVKAVSLSLFGVGFSAEEYVALKKLEAKGVKIFAAAGNDKKNLDKICSNYPACYKISTLVAVGALNECGDRANYSAYGSKVEIWYPGYVDIDSVRRYGTSYSTASAAGDYINALDGNKPLIGKKVEEEK